MSRETGIYQIRHVASGRIYVGQTVDFGRRWAKHRLELNRGRHHNPHLLAAWEMYGPDAFVFEPLIICRLNDLDLYEQCVLDGFSPEFNWAKTASSRRGVPMSAETRAKIGAALKGRKRPAEFCEKLRVANFGKVASPESKAKMRAAKVGRPLCPEHAAKVAHNNRTRVRTPEEYESRRGRKCDPAVVAKSAEARRGQKRTPEQRARMSEAALRRQRRET